MHLPDSYATDGFATVRGLLSAHEVVRVRAAFDRMVQVAATLTESADVGDARFVVTANPYQLHRVVWCGGADPVLAAFGDDPRFLSLASQALASNELMQLIQQAHFKLPGDGVQFAWHQDASNRRYGSDLWTDIGGDGSFVQIVVAVDPMHKGNGGLGVVRGSHTAGFRADPSTGKLPDDAVNDNKIVYPDLDAGDALVFGAFVVHGSGVNRSTTARRAFLQGYALPGANGRSYPGAGLGVTRSVRG